MLQGRQRCGAGSAVVTRNQNHVCLGLGDSGGHGANTRFADEFHVDASLVVGVLEVKNQLGQVLD